MPGPAWGNDPPQDDQIIDSNVRRLMNRLVTDAPARISPTLHLAHAWHRDLYANVPSVPSLAYLGNPRGSGHPHLIDYEVGLVNSLSKHMIAEGVPAGRVLDQLQHFEQALQKTVKTVDALIAQGVGPRDSDQVSIVALLAATVHGEWIRIHPYANANGRVARVWANWALLRYDVPPVVRVKPRPGDQLYATAAYASMGTRPDFLGNHDLMHQWVIDEIRFSVP
jgi:hypothetical protein